jgi:hypothetical protein
MMETPDYISRVAAVRIWRVAPHLWAQLGGLLWAPAVQEPWPTGEEFYAKCTTHLDSAPPRPGCGCGIYAFYTPKLAQPGGYWVDSSVGPTNRLVAGVIGAAGEVELCEFGLRAERATVEAIFTVGAFDHEIPIPRQEIAAAYGAEVISADDYEEFCAERGLVVIDPSSLED